MLCFHSKSLYLACVHSFILCFFKQPRCVVEVKKSVSLLSSCDPKHVCQLFIEGLGTQESIILILTDSSMFHVFESPLLPLIILEWHICLSKKTEVINLIAYCLAQVDAWWSMNCVIITCLLFEMKLGKICKDSCTYSVTPRLANLRRLWNISLTPGLAPLLFRLCFIWNISQN